MKEHLTAGELLLSLKFCKGYLGGVSCVGCPNAIPEVQNILGNCFCRFDIADEMIHLLESIVNK